MAKKVHTGLEILAIPMDGKNDANATSIREYLCCLLRELWDKDEGFSGKRPFGNSGWQYDLLKPLVEHEVIKGHIDHFDELDDHSAPEADWAMRLAIGALGKAP